MGKGNETMRSEEIERAYKAMKDAKSYTAFKDRKRHYERLLRKARLGNG